MKDPTFESGHLLTNTHEHWRLSQKRLLTLRCLASAWRQAPKACGRPEREGRHLFCRRGTL